MLNGHSTLAVTGEMKATGYLRAFRLQLLMLNKKVGCELCLL
jgi:hypothetical protein